MGALEDADVGLGQNLDELDQPRHVLAVVGEGILLEAAKVGANGLSAAADSYQIGQVMGGRRT